MLSHINANLAVLSDEAAKDNQSLKSKLLLSKNSDNKQQGERVLGENVFFVDQKKDLNIVKANFPENTLICTTRFFFQQLRDKI